MRNCLVVYLVGSIYLSARGLKLAHSSEEIVQNASYSWCTSPSNGSTITSSSSSSIQNPSQEVEKVHRRDKRYLLFAKGSFVSVTTAVVKTILPGIPRGFNIICEESLYYDLPSSLTLPPRKDLMKSPAPEPAPAPVPKTIKRKHDFYQMYKNHDYYAPYKWNYVPKHDFKNYFNNEKHYFRYPGYVDHFPRGRRRFRSASFTDDVEELISSLDVEAIFFQQIENFAERLGFNSRYCIMRTLCESNHILFPKGQSLFHDVIRNILRYSLPKLKENPKYLKALSVGHLMDCANLYGPHCKISFIDYFTFILHGNDKKLKIV